LISDGKIAEWWCELNRNKIPKELEQSFDIPWSNAQACLILLNQMIDEDQRKKCLDEWVRQQALV